MIDLIRMFGIRLQLLIGPNVPRPAPYEVMEALIGLQVINSDSERDGFQMDFMLGKDARLDYSLLRSDALKIENQVIIILIFGARPQVLINGIITKHQVEPSNKPGGSMLHVTGEDISVKLDMKEQNATHANQSDSTIVKKMLTDAGFIPQIEETTDTPSDRERVVTQQCSNLRFIQKLAQRNGFIFYIEPSEIPGINRAYWGKENRKLPSQPALMMNMGPLTNVDEPINFSFNALGPVKPEITILNPFTKQPIEVPIPDSVLPSLSNQSATPLRSKVSRDAANLSFAQALLKAMIGAKTASDALEASGQVDVVRYGHALRSRQLVRVMGAGQTYDGDYYVKKVTHNIKLLPKPDYKQSFELRRDGRGAIL